MIQRTRDPPELPGPSPGLDPDVPALDSDDFIRHADQSLDVADIRLLGELEDGHVPPMEPDFPGPREEGDRNAFLHDVDPVAREAGRVVDGGHVPAVLAGTPADPRTRPQLGPIRIDLAVGVDGEHVPAFRAGDLLMTAHQRGSHRAGRDDEAFGFDTPDEERHEHDHERLDRFSVAPSPAPRCRRIFRYECRLRSRLGL